MTDLKSKPTKPQFQVGDAVTARGYKSDGKLHYQFGSHDRPEVGIVESVISNDRGSWLTLRVAGQRVVCGDWMVDLIQAVRAPVPEPVQPANIIDILESMSSLKADELTLIQSKADRLNPSPGAKKRERKMAGDAPDGDAGKYTEIYYVPRTLKSGVKAKYQYERWVWWITTASGKRIKRTEHIRGSGKRVA